MHRGSRDGRLGVRLGVGLGVLRCLAAGLLVGVLLRGGVAAQAPAASGQPAVAAPTGTVTGRVICADTQRPARFAQVTLERVPAADASANGDRRGFGGAGARTGLDGTFTATNVTPGDYYVMASAPGYVPERALVQAAVNAGTDPAAVLARVAMVRVSADSSSAVTVSMERGGTLGGRVQWEDGSPASGLTVMAAAATPVALPAGLRTFGGGFGGGFGSGFDVGLAVGPGGGGSSFATTDDRGAFRLTGLPGGAYVLQVTIRAPAAAPDGGFGGGFGGGPGGRDGFFGSPITVYAPGVFHKAEAKPITVRAGDERDDLRMVINLGSLRRVTGHVSSATAGQSVASGRVTLSDPNDRSVTLVGSVGANGDFLVGYVPPGTYSLQVNASTAAQGGYARGRGGSGGSSFQPATQAVIVGQTDVTGLGITLTPLQAAQ